MDLLPNDIQQIIYHNLHREHMIPVCNDICYKILHRDNCTFLKVLDTQQEHYAFYCISMRYNYCNGEHMLIKPFKMHSYLSYTY